MQRSVPKQGGFTVLEMLVTLFVTVEIMLAVLALFDFNNKLSRVQTQVSEVQQQLRTGQYEAVKMLRIAGRGGLPAASPAFALPTGLAVSVRDNQAAGTQVAIGDSSPTAAQSRVVGGTDVLTVRGAFSNPVYLVNYLDPNSRFKLYSDASATTLTGNPAVAQSGTVQICSVAEVMAGATAAATTVYVPQDLAPLVNLIAAAASGTVPKDALLMVSQSDATLYGVTELDLVNSAVSPGNCPQPPPPAAPALPYGPPWGVLLRFKVGQPAGTARVDNYRLMAPVGVAENLPARLTSVGTISILEEYRYYLRQDTFSAGDPSLGLELAPHFTRAHFYPNTEEPYLGDTQNLRLDIADNILDFQISLGTDGPSQAPYANNRDGRSDEYLVNNGLPAATGTVPTAVTDEWLFNDPADVVANFTNAQLLYVRVTTLARTERRDFQYQSPTYSKIEDHLYAGIDATSANTAEGRMYRHRLMQTTVRPRNL